MKSKIIPVVVLAIIILGTLGAWFFLNQNNQGQTQVLKTQVSTPTPMPTSTPATGITQEEIDAMKKDATTFYTACFKKDFNTAKTLTTNSFASSLDSVINGGTDDSLGAYTAYNISTYTDVSTPVSVGEPEEIAKNAECAVPLTIKDDYIARVGFQRDSNGKFRIFSFNMQSSSRGNGGVAGAGGN